MENIIWNIYALDRDVSWDWSRCDIATWLSQEKHFELFKIVLSD